MRDFFSKKNVIITGGNSGSGLSISRAFLNLGSNVIRIDKKFDTKIGSSDFIFNLEKYEKLDVLINKIKKKFKKIDVLVNNAGITLPSKDSWKNYEVYQKTLAILIQIAFYN